MPVAEIAKNDLQLNLKVWIQELNYSHGDESKKKLRF